MEISYWESRWNKGKTGWHMQQVYPLLKRYAHRVMGDEPNTILVPLCGKSLDVGWLVAQGHHVVGVDVSAKAIAALRDHHPEPMEPSTVGEFVVFKGASLTLWQGDFFTLPAAALPPIDVIYDKAALIALPPRLRVSYAGVIRTLRQPHTSVLLNCFEYEQEEMNGPPFAVFPAELERLYGASLSIEVLHREPAPDIFAGFKRRGLQSYLRETLYLLQPNAMST